MWSSKDISDVEINILLLHQVWTQFQSLSHVPLQPITNKKYIHKTKDKTTKTSKYFIVKATGQIKHDQPTVRIMYFPQIWNKYLPSYHHTFGEHEEHQA